MQTLSRIAPLLATLILALLLSACGAPATLSPSAADATATALAPTPTVANGQSGGAQPTGASRAQPSDTATSTATVTPGQFSNGDIWRISLAGFTAPNANGTLKVTFP